MQACEHPLERRQYGMLLRGALHREVEFCQRCHHFRLVLDPLRGWLVLRDKSEFEREVSLRRRPALAGVASSH